MKRLCIFLILLPVVFFLTACEEEPPPPKPKPPKTAPQKPQSQAQTEPARESAWPFMASDSDDAELATNLMAKNYVLIFDGSGSMNDVECSAGKRKIDAAKSAVTEWSKSIPADANLGLVSFHSRGWSHLALASGSVANFGATLQPLGPGGKTPLTKALANAYAELTKQGRKQLGYGEYTIVIVTDGIANNETLLAQEVKKILAESPVCVFTIGFCIGDRHSLNQPGQTEYRAADNPTQLREGLAEVLAESESFDDATFDQ